MSDSVIWTCNPVFNQFKYPPIIKVRVPYLDIENRVQWRMEEQPLRVYEFSHVYKCHDIKIK